MSETLKDMLQKQLEFSKNFYDVVSLTESERVERHKIFCLAMHSELSRLANSVNFREHRPFEDGTQKQNILYETMDVFRYCLAVLNLWGYDESDIVEAFHDRDVQLNLRLEKSLKNWNGQPVIVVDVDDVLSRFRKSFYSWMNEKYGPHFDENSTEYYISKAPDGKGGDVLLKEFIDEGKIKTLEVCDNVVAGLRKLRENGYWIHILTARPSSELKCFYETYSWLAEKVVEFDSVQFSPEKYIAVAGMKPYKEGKVVCAIDDSAKHSAEFAMHDVTCLVPRRSYNSEVWSWDNIVPFDWETSDISSIINNLS